MKLRIENPFRVPTAKELARKELADAERELMRHQALVEEHSAGVACYQVRIARLNGMLNLQHPHGSQIVDTVVSGDTVKTLHTKGGVR